MWGVLNNETPEIKAEKDPNHKFQRHKMSDKAKRKFMRKMGEKPSKNEQEEDEEQEDMEEENDIVEQDFDDDQDEEIEDDEEEEEEDPREEEVLPPSKKYKPEKTDFSFNQVLKTDKIVATLPGKKRDLKKELNHALKKKQKFEKLGKTQDGLEALKQQKLKEALVKTTGIKIKNEDPKVLKNIIKRKEQQKRKSAKLWAERNKTVESELKERQEKRQQNLSTKRIRGKKEFQDAKKVETGGEEKQESDKNDAKRVGKGRFNRLHDKVRAEKKGSGDRYEKKTEPETKKGGKKVDSKKGGNKKRKERK